MLFFPWRPLQADLCVPRLNEGDQVVLINGRDISDHTHDQVVMFIKASCESHSGELILLVRPNGERLPLVGTCRCVFMNEKGTAENYKVLLALNLVITIKQRKNYCHIHLVTIITFFYCIRLQYVPVVFLLMPRHPTVKQC